MNGSAIKFLRKNASPYPNKVILDELVKIYGEENVLEGKINVWQAVKKLWKSKSSKEKKQWREVLA